MNRTNVNRYIARLKSIRAGRQQGANRRREARPRMLGSKKISLFIVVGVLGCMVLTVFGTMARRNAATASEGLLTTRGLIAVPTAGTLALEGTKDEYLAPTGFAADGQSRAALVPEKGPGNGTTTNSPPATGGNAAPAAQNWDRLIIRTATLQLNVKDVAASLDTVRSLAGTHGGYIASSDSRVEGEYTVATITLQVPAAQFDDAMTQLRKVGIKTISENVSSSDVTEEFTDLESQLRNLRATEQRIQALMGKAEQIEVILTLDRELRQIQSEIERAMGRTNYLSKRAAMSSITVSLFPEVAVVKQQLLTEEGWNPGKIASQAWNASLEMLSNIATVGITVAVFMWWAIPLLLLALWLAVRPRRTTPSTSSPTPDAA